MTEGKKIINFLEYIVKHLVEDTESVKIEIKEEERNLILRLKVAPGDRGRIIGKQGKMIKALRRLINAVSETEKRVALELLE